MISSAIINKYLRHLIPGGGVIIFLLLAILITGSTMKKNELKIFAIKYGDSLFPEKYMYNKSSSGRYSQFTWLCYYVEYGSRRILIDSGFNDQSFIKLFNIKNYLRPAEILRQNGINAESITDIIITHGHFDHAGGITDYPGARIIISSAELEEIRKNKYGKKIRDAFLERDAVTEFDDSFRLDDFLLIKKIGGHTAGSSVVYLDIKNHHYCFTGDEIYSIRSIDEKIPNGTTVNIANNIQFINQYDRKYIPLTFHNPEFYISTKCFIPVINQ